MREQGATVIEALSTSFLDVLLFCYRRTKYKQGTYLISLSSSVVT